MPQLAIAGYNPGMVAYGARPLNAQSGYETSPHRPIRACGRPEPISKSEILSAIPINIHHPPQSFHLIGLAYGNSPFIYTHGAIIGSLSKTKSLTRTNDKFPRFHHHLLGDHKMFSKLVSIVHHKQHLTSHSHSQETA
jgi:hypothetical protein